MPPERRHHAEQEISIKARDRELYVEKPLPSVPAPVTKPFAVYLRETPADPLSSGVKAALWVAGVIVLLLLVAAIWRSQRSPRGRARAGTAASVTVRSGYPAAFPRLPLHGKIESMRA